MAAVNNDTLAAIAIVGDALFNDSSGESSDEERAMFGLEPKQERKVVAKVYHMQVGMGKMRRCGPADRRTGKLPTKSCGSQVRTCG